jgi:regulator of protease activity HflC (stomatin/prohibitin superfamily)
MNITLVLNAVVSLLWLITVGLIVLAVIRAFRGYKVRALSITILVTGVAAALLTSLNSGLVFITPEERGVVISAIAPNGYRQNALQPGLNWIIPFVESVKTYPISRQTYTMSIAPNEGQVQGDDSITARTADGQEVLIDSSVIYAIDPAQVIQLHIIWQDRYTNDLVRPVSRGAIRDAVSQFGIAEVYSTKRGELSTMIAQELHKKFDENGLVLIDFVLRNITFSPEYAASVEQKQIAEQQAQQAKFVVEQRKQEAEQARQVAQGKADASVIQAKGDAEARLIQADAESRSLKLIADALRDHPDLLNYTFIQKMAPGVQTMFLPNDVPYLLPLPTPESAMAQGLLESVTGASPTPLPTPSPTPTANP